MNTPAMIAVNRAKKAGRLPLPSICESCGRGRTNGRSGGMHYHHWSYLPEHHLDVIPLCIACHRRVHHGKIPEPRTGRVYDPPTARAGADHGDAIADGRYRVALISMLRHRWPRGERGKIRAQIAEIEARYPHWKKHGGRVKRGVA